MALSTFSLSLKSMRARAFTTFLSVFSIALSVTLLLSVERLRESARLSFEKTLSGTDLIVGARSGSIQLLLYSVFHLGDASNNISYDSYERYAQHPSVKWAVPLSLGDSHKGFRVVGTSPAYFEQLRYGDGQALEFAAGVPFARLFDVVIGAEVATKLGYELDSQLTLSHGLQELEHLQHKAHPFRVVGLLKATGTPVDRSLLVSLAAIEAIHVGWENGLAPAGQEATPLDSTALRPSSLTAFMLGLKTKLGIFHLQRAINDDPEEPLSAILPGSTFAQLWQLLGSADKALLLISILIVCSTLLGMLASILSRLSERRREIAILRSVGATPGSVFLLFLWESFLLSTLGALLGLALSYALLLALGPYLSARLGMQLPLNAPAAQELLLLAGVVLGGLVVGVLPALSAYWHSLKDGLETSL